MNKTIYIRDEDVDVWDRARELAGDKLSPVIVSALKNFVAGKEAQMKGFERIVIQYRDVDASSLPKAKAFYGKWIIEPDTLDLGADDPEKYARFQAIALTAKGKVVVYSYVTGQSGKRRERFYIFDSLEEAANDLELNWSVCQAVERLGVPVEELDI